MCHACTEEQEEVMHSGTLYESKQGHEGDRCQQTQFDFLSYCAVEAGEY